MAAFLATTSVAAAAVAARTTDGRLKANKLSNNARAASGGRNRRCGARVAAASAAAAAASASVAASQADFDALWLWLGSKGVDTSGVSPRLMDDGPGGRGWGLVAAKNLGGNETALSVPASLWMTAKTARASPVGPFVEGQLPWVAVALQLLHEKAKGASSAWAAYVATLPAALDAPLFWTPPQLAELAGTQLLQNAAGYDSYVRGTYRALDESAMEGNPGVFPPEVFTEQAFVWAFGVLRSRALPPVDQGDGIALVPGLDLANHSGLSSATWTLNNGGLGSVFRGGAGPSMLLRTEKKGGLAAGAELVMNYGPAKIDSQFALDYGFADEFCSRPGYVLGPIAIPDTDANCFDKVDVLQVAGLLEAPAFTIRAFEDPPPEMRIFMRLLNLKGQDAFLLEAIFRKEAWGLISDPVSLDNETDACTTMINGCEEALAAYPTRVEDDRVAAEDTSSDPRRRLAARVRLGEKQALTEVMGFYSAVEVKLDKLEYYQERRLRSLNLLDRDGSSTYDPFEETMA